MLRSQLVVEGPEGGMAVLLGPLGQETVLEGKFGMLGVELQSLFQKPFTADDRFELQGRAHHIPYGCTRPRVVFA